MTRTLTIRVCRGYDGKDIQTAERWPETVAKRDDGCLS